MRVAALTLTAVALAGTVVWVIFTGSPASSLESHQAGGARLAGMPVDQTTPAPITEQAGRRRGKDLPAEAEAAPRQPAVHTATHVREKSAADMSPREEALRRLTAPWRREIILQHLETVEAGGNGADRLIAAKTILATQIAYELETSGEGEPRGPVHPSRVAAPHPVRFGLDGRSYRFAEGTYPIWDEAQLYHPGITARIGEGFYDDVKLRAATVLSRITE